MVVTLASVNSVTASLLSTAGTFPQYCLKLLDVCEQLLLYAIKLYIGITTSIY